MLANFVDTAAEQYYPSSQVTLAVVVGQCL
jgi:hypothetical protein